MSSVKILITLPQSIVGGADVKSLNTLRALKMIGYDISPFAISFNAKFYFIDYLRSYSSLLKRVFKCYSDSYHKVIVITTYPQYVYPFLRLRETDNIKISVLWLPGGNDFCCPLHTEVCPKSVLESSYGCAYSISYFLTTCIPHILRLKRFSIYHSFIWPILRYNAIKHLDGLLASRSVYIKGCKYIGYEKCHYVGFGLDTELFKYRDKAYAIKILRNLSKNVLWGDFYSFLENIKKDESVTIGYVGAAEPWWKNTEILLRVFKRLQCQNVSARHKIWLLIVGRSVNKLLSSLSAIPESIREKIVIIDRISYEAIPYVYNIIDIFVNPSYLDSLEFNTLEALASGIIVLASNRGSIDDLNNFNIDVLKFDPDPDSLLKLLKNVLLNLESFKRAFLTKSSNVKRFAGLEAYALRLKDALNNYIE